jgi:hypothetical protein
MRSNTWGGGPSIDSNATVAPPPALGAIAYEPLPDAPPLAQPPSAEAATSSAAAIMARGIRRVGALRVLLIVPCDIVKMC